MRYISWAVEYKLSKKDGVFFPTSGPSNHKLSDVPNHGVHRGPSSPLNSRFPPKF